MALYLGETLITPIMVENNDTTEWWSGKNVELLYTSNYNCKLSETDFSTQVSGITNQTGAITVTLPDGNNVIYDSWGVNKNNGVALDFGKNNYFIIADGLIDIHYTTEESSVVNPHALKYTITSLISVCQQLRIASDQIIYPTDITYGSNIAAGLYNGVRTWYKNASGVFTTSNASYGIYCTFNVPTFSNSNNLIINYLSFKTPNLNIRKHNGAYAHDTSFALIDAENTNIYTRQKLYRVDKPCIYESLINRLGWMYENNTLPTD